MTSNSTSPQAVRPPRLVVFLATAVLLLVAGWAMTHLYINSAPRKCMTMYRSARTAADTARVDSTVPEAQGHAGLGPVTCRFIRTKARWNWPSDSGSPVP